MNDNTDEMLPPPSAEQATGMIAAVLDSQAEPAVTESLRTVLDLLGADTDADLSSGNATIMEWTIYTGDGIVMLNWGITPSENGQVRGFTLHRYQHAESRRWGD